MCLGHRPLAPLRLHSILSYKRPHRCDTIFYATPYNLSNMSQVRNHLLFFVFHSELTSAMMLCRSMLNLQHSSIHYQHSALTTTQFQCVILTSTPLLPKSSFVRGSIPAYRPQM